MNRWIVITSFLLGYSKNFAYLCKQACENGRSSERQHACMIGRVAPDEGKANGLHLGKERASKLAVTIYLLGTRFAPSLSHAFSQRHHFILLNYPVELLPRKGLNEQNYTSLKLRTKRRLHHRCIGAVAGLTGYMGRGLRFLYAHTDSASPLPDFDERIIK